MLEIGSKNQNERKKIEKYPKIYDRNPPKIDLDSESGSGGSGGSGSSRGIILFWGKRRGNTSDHREDDEALTRALAVTAAVLAIRHAWPKACGIHYILALCSFTFSLSFELLALAVA